MLARKLPFLKIRTRTTAKFVNVVISPMLTLYNGAMKIGVVFNQFHFIG